MGFPLSTDIFGQLRWLVRQVKLLVYRVTKIEQGGGAGAQNISQVLTTGNTAVDKDLIIQCSFIPETYTIAAALGNNAAGFVAKRDDNSFRSSLSAVGFVSESSVLLKHSQLSANSVFFADFTSVNSVFIEIADFDNGLDSGKGSILRTKGYQYLNDLTVEAGFNFNYINGIYQIGAYSSGNISPIFFEINDVDSSITSVYGGIQNGLTINFGSNTFRLGNFDGILRGLDINIGPTIGEYILGNQDGAFFRVYDADTGSFIVTSFPGGGESGLGLFNDSGEYKLGDFGSTAQPDTHNVYLNVISNKANASIKSYYQGFNNGLYIDHITGIYGFRNEQNEDVHFGININTPSAPALDISNEFMAGGTFATPAGNLRVLINGTPFYIELWQ